MRKFSTLEENILLSPNSPKKIKLFINSELRKIRLIEKGPNEYAVKMILNYAKALSVHKTKKTGTVNVILN